MRVFVVFIALASLICWEPSAHGAVAPDLPGDRADAIAQSLMSPF